MTRSIAAILPVRSFRSGKARLTDAVDGDTRAELVRRMLDHVLTAATSASVFRQVAVVSPDPEVLAWVGLHHAGVIGLHQNELAPGLLAALDQGRAWVVAQGHDALAILFADLPVVTAADIRTLVATEGTVVLAPDQLGTGTNAMLLRSDGLELADFVFQFGPGSFAAHLTEAARLELTPAVVRSAGLAFDLDTPSDLAQLQQHFGTHVMRSGRTAS
ncbi:MAG TPA: 2-phospho-L-lactate guanylyltransferase [Thermomicrobiales bacterium]|mgnify:CR=1 FL=1|nr:2-phospho-L-lactate guanylyltransferase [Thermomicrobiales bacterium]